jgi:hypothetical protein
MSGELVKPPPMRLLPEGQTALTYSLVPVRAVAWAETIWIWGGVGVYGLTVAGAVAGRVATAGRLFVAEGAAGTLPV